MINTAISFANAVCLLASEGVSAPIVGYLPRVGILKQPGVGDFTRQEHPRNVPMGSRNATECERSSQRRTRVGLELVHRQEAGILLDHRVQWSSVGSSL